MKRFAMLLLAFGLTAPLMACYGPYDHGRGHHHHHGGRGGPYVGGGGGYGRR
ncbi:hypothetical protein DmGdi_07140 [Gluconobacter sp. Gdi]|nr:hypothetical protein DmGdi_07140 [Gluconobacter sp. Gdi]